MSFLAYNLVLILLSPLLVLYFIYRIVISGKSRSSWIQQLGWVRIPDGLQKRDRVWIHAVSVGESVASAAVVSELKSELPEVAVILSTTTQTGQDMAYKSVKEADAIIYYPVDLLPCVWLALSRVCPAVFASTDTEIWPNFRHLARSRGVRNAIVNGTISDKTVAGARKVPWIYRWALSNIDSFCMQSQADAERIIRLGADPEKVTVTGNCKADQADSRLSPIEAAEVRALIKIPEGARVFVAGSTNPGEDVPVLDAFLSVRETCGDLRLVIAPRQIERCEEIEALAVERGLRIGHRSNSDTISGTEDVVVLDTFGELARVYGIADVTFVGGSLIPKGCHSILQPIAQGKPVLFGPHTFKARDLVAQAKEAGVGFQVQDGADLANQVARLLADPALLSDISDRCEQMMQANRGAARRTAAVLAELYKEVTGGRQTVDQ